MVPRDTNLTFLQILILRQIEENKLDWVNIKDLNDKESRKEYKDFQK